MSGVSMKSPSGHSYRDETRPPYTWNIIAAITGAEDIDATEMQPPLYTVIDPEALETILQTSDEHTTVTFRYKGLRIDISGDGTVSVTDPCDSR